MGGQAAGVRQLLLLCLPYSFSSTHPVPFCPSEDEQWVPAMFPVMVPFQMSPPARCQWLLVPQHMRARRRGLRRDQQQAPHLCPVPAAYTPNLHHQQNPSRQGCCNFGNHTANPFLLNQQNEEKKQREAKTCIAQASSNVAAAGL